MEWKDIGRVDLRPASRREVDERLGEMGDRLAARTDRFAREPIPTGSLALDRATGLGGLPRGAVVALAGPAAVGEAVVLSVIARVQEEGGAVVVIDPADRLRARLARHPGVDPELLLLVRPGDEVELRRFLLALLRRRAADLIVVAGLGEARARGGGRRGEEDAEADASLAQSLAGSRGCVLVLEDPGKAGEEKPAATAAVRAALARLAKLRLEAVGRPAGGSLVKLDLSGSRAAAVSPGKVRLHLDPAGALSRPGDLLETGLAGELIELRGSRYHFGGELLGRGRKAARRALQETPDLALQIESALERSTETLRRKAGEGRVGLRVASTPMDVTEALDFEGLDDPADVPLGHERAGKVVEGGRRRSAPDRAARESRPLERTRDRSRSVSLGLEKSTGRPARAPAPRHVNTWFEGEAPVLPLTVGREVPFHLRIGVRRSGEASQSAPFAEPADWGGRSFLDLVVSLYSRDFRIEPRQLPLVLPREGDSEALTFRCTPLRPGGCRLRIVLSLARELEMLQRLEVEVPVIPAEKVAAEAG